MSNTAAFFDLDGTLLSVNSGRLWVAFERRLGRITGAKYAEALLYFALYRLDRIDMHAVLRKALSVYEGEREEVLRARTRRWYLDEVAPKVAPGAYPVLDAHRAAGHRLVLLTSSSVYESEIATEHLGLDDYLAATYEVVDGCFTGEPSLPLCYGAGKVHFAEDYARRHDVDLATSFFYTDSVTDIPMLQRVGQPRVVNPDLGLRWAARRQGWRILDWGRPEVAATTLNR
ncbi:MAG: HAD-IB family hydrolase [Proteobacteria bacterium]|nr:MAG: HAD-IB family hydrolase [Pseudomonadota bacterium]